jgi:hypothetical protein
MCIRSLLVCSTKPRDKNLFGQEEPPTLTPTLQYPRTDDDVLSTWEARRKELGAIYRNKLLRYKACSRPTVSNLKLISISGDSCPGKTISHFFRMYLTSGFIDALESNYILDAEGYIS